MLRRLGEERAAEIAVDQAREVVDFRLDVRQLLKAEGVAHAHGGAGALLLVGGKILVADGAGRLGGLPVEVGPGPGEPGLHVGVGGVQLGEEGGFVPALRRREAGGHHRPAHFPALVSLIVDVVVQGYGADDENVIAVSFSRSFRQSPGLDGPGLIVLPGKQQHGAHRD